MNSQDNDPKIARIKDILRFLFFIAVSWFISETLKQVQVVPDFYTLKVWVFTYLIPVRFIFVTALTAALSYIDRRKFLADGKGLTGGK